MIIEWLTPQLVDTMQNIVAIPALLGLFNMVITFPILFNYWLIPRLELKFGRKLYFCNEVNTLKTTRYLKLSGIYRWWWGPMNLGFEITILFLLCKVFKQDIKNRKNLINPSNTLIYAGYSLADLDTLETTMGVLYGFNVLVLFFGFGLIFWLLGKFTA
jgi:hypothetical protein